MQESDTDLKTSPRSHIGGGVTQVSPFLPVLLVVIALGLPLAWVSSNPALTFFALGLLPVFFRLLWRHGEPPVLLFAIGFQWLQVSMAVFHADFLGIVVDDLPEYANVQLAITYSLFGLLVLVLGIRLGMGRTTYKLASVTVENWSVNKIWKLYLAFLAAGLLSKGVAWVVPQLTQVILVLFNVKWVVFFVLAYLVLYRGKGYRLLLLAIMIEVVIGLTGFFSGYKQVFFILILAYFTARPKFRAKEYFAMVLVLNILLALTIFWSAVKVEYRYFVSDGTGEQVVYMSFDERAHWMYEAATNMQSETMWEGVHAMSERIAYVQYFSHVIDYVPFYTLHTDGDIWGGAIKHVLMPRLIFPDKPALESDTVLTDRYTGLGMAYMAGRTSISTGYMAESYIDFGFPLMYAPIFLLGMLWGWVYRYFMNRPDRNILHAGMASAVLLGAMLFEINSAKLLGSVLTSFIVMALIAKYVEPRFRKMLSRDEVA